MTVIDSFDDDRDSDGQDTPLSAVMLSTDQQVRVAALQAAVEMVTGRDLEKILRRATYMADWINGHDVAELDIPDDLKN